MISVAGGEGAVNPPPCGAGRRAPYRRTSCGGHPNHKGPATRSSAPTGTLPVSAPSLSCRAGFRAESPGLSLVEYLLPWVQCVGCSAMAMGPSEGKVSRVLQDRDVHDHQAAFWKVRRGTAMGVGSPPRLECVSLGRGSRRHRQGAIGFDFGYDHCSRTTKTGKDILALGQGVCPGLRPGGSALKVWSPEPVIAAKGVDQHIATLHIQDFVLAKIVGQVRIPEPNSLANQFSELFGLHWVGGWGRSISTFTTTYYFDLH